MVAGAFLLTGALPLTGQDASLHVQALLNGFSAGFHFLVLKVLRFSSYMFILTFLSIDG